MTKVKGPKDGKIVTASFDPQSKKDNSKTRFPSLKTTKDLVLLSIKGNEFCAGEYLGAIVQQAVATHQTTPDYSGVKGKTTFLIADEIYWHNLKEKSAFSPDEEVNLKQKALELGEQYFESNLGAFLTPLGLTVEEFKNRYPEQTMDEKITIINQLALEQGKNFEIVRWHTWVTQRDFDKTLPDILPFYEEVEGLKVAIDKSVQEFVKRHEKDGADRGIWTERSRSYLKEESPSIMLLAAHLGYNFINYPGAILPPFEATRNYFIVDNHIARIENGESVKNECTHNKFCLHSDNPSRLVNWLEINFQRSHEVKKAYEPNNTITLFKPNQSNVIPYKKIITGVENEEAMVASVAPKQEAMISSITQGISRALENEFSKKKNLDPKNKATPTQLTQIFEGITRGILSTDLPVKEKIGFMSELIDKYMNRHDSLDLDHDSLVPTMSASGLE